MALHLHPENSFLFFSPWLCICILHLKTEKCFQSGKQITFFPGKLPDSLIGHFGEYLGFIWKTENCFHWKTENFFFENRKLFSLKFRRILGCYYGKQKTVFTGKQKTVFFDLINSPQIQSSTLGLNGRCHSLLPTQSMLPPCALHAICKLHLGILQRRNCTLAPLSTNTRTCSSMP
jgi:hypothetical protein